MSINKIKVFTIFVNFVALALNQITNAEVTVKSLLGIYHLIAISRDPSASSLMSCERMGIKYVDSLNIIIWYLGSRNEKRYIYQSMAEIHGSEAKVFIITGPNESCVVPYYYSVTNYNHDTEMIWIDKNSTQIHKLYSKERTVSEESREAFDNYVTQKGIPIKYITEFDCQ